MNTTTKSRNDGFRERGANVTRLEAFVDAAFAFAVTMVVISVGSVPQSVAELGDALLRAPAFAASFALIAMFWYAHNVWSRRYGLDDMPSVLLSLVLVFLVMIYVYPLKMLFGGFFNWISQGYLPAGFRVNSLEDIKAMFLIYAVAWSTLGLVIVLLYRHAWRRRAQLELSEHEAVQTYAIAWHWWMVPLTGFAALVLAITMPERPSAIRASTPGMVYFLMGASGLMHAWGERRARKRLGIAPA
jgi:uncharacterized membrane protein